MSERRIYCPNLSPGIVALEPEQARHALRSLRLRPGDALTLFDGKGRVAHAVLVAARDLAARQTPGARREVARVRGGAKDAICAAVDAVLTVPAPARPLTLISAACKGARLDWLVEKCTELGATRMVFANFARSVVRLGADAADRLRRTAVEACKQSRRAWLPEIIAGVPLERALTYDSGWRPARGGDAALLVADLDSSAALLSGWLHAHAAALRQLFAVVGPEGGLADADRDLLTRAGGQSVRLAEGVLRTETAAVSVAAHWASRGEPA